MRWPTVVDLYSGCGGVTAAMKRLQFTVVAAVDNDPIAGKTYSKNNNDVHLYLEDISKVAPKNIRKYQLHNKNLDLLIVCSPCQPFSNQNRNRGNDNRANLVLQAVRFAKILNPKIIFFENVPGLIRSGISNVYADLNKNLKNIGYNLSETATVDLANYGVPQRRLRCVLFAARDGYSIELPAGTTPIPFRETVRMAIADLPELKSGDSDPSDSLHFARNHQPIALKRMAHIEKNGGNRFSLPPELELDCHRGKKGFPDVYGRMWWDRVAPTLTTGCTDVTRGRYMHPVQNRAISLREAARLQTFPDEYIFEGNASQIATQIGNAVPPKFIEAVAPTIRQALGWR